LEVECPRNGSTENARNAVPSTVLREKPKAIVAANADEICYTAHLRKGWTLKPDFQYIWQVGGGAPKPSGRGTVPNAAVWGLRTTINF